MANNAEFRRVVNYSDLERLLECPLCLDRFDQPRLIPCGHTYCTKCLIELSAGNDTIICPQCREEHVVPSNGIKHFPRNLSYQQLLDIRTEQLVSTRQCQVCDRKRAFSDCLHCQKSVCLDCKKLHRKELIETTQTLLNDLSKSTELCNDALNGETRAFLSHCDAIKRQISTHAKQTIDFIKQQAKQLSHELDSMITEQLESSKNVLIRFEKTKDEIVNFVRSAQQGIDKTESILDENYLDIQNTTTNHLNTLQNVIKTLKTHRKDIVFTPNFILRDENLGTLTFATSNVTFEPLTSLSSTIATNVQTTLVPPSTIRHIGRYGHEPNQFWCPSGLTMTKNNEHLIVVDSWNHRIQMLTTDGQLVRMTNGEKGRNLNEMNNPRDICLNQSQELMIVSDSGNHRILIFQLENFQIQRAIGVTQDATVKFYFPFGICCDQNDHLYVCDRGNNRIVVVDLHRDVLIRHWGRKGVGPGEFDAPDFICCRQEILAVSDFNNHRVQVFNLNGQFLFEFGKLGSGHAGEFRYPRGIAIDDVGFFMVADWANNRLQLFTPKGELSAIVGEKTTESTNEDLTLVKVEFDRPIGLTISDQGVVYITEWGRSHRIVIY